MSSLIPNPKPILILGALDGPDGNAFVILGRAHDALKNAGCSKEQMDAFQKEATSGDYEHLLDTCDDWFELQ